MTQKTLGQFIREERDKRDISLRELARRLDISPPALSDIELGRHFPSDITLKAIAKEFETTVEKLRQFDHRESLTDFKRLVESEPELSFAFRSTMSRVRAGKLTPEDLTKMLNKTKKPS